MFTGISAGGGPQGAAAATATATSVTSLATAGSGDKAFTTQAGKPYLVGTRLRATSAATGEWMEGVVKTYATTTLTVTMDKNSGIGTHADWNITIAGQPGTNGNNGVDGVTWTKISIPLATLQAKGAVAAATFSLGSALASPCVISAAMIRIVAPLVGVALVSSVATVGVAGDNSLLTAGLDVVSGAADAYRAQSNFLAKFSSTLQPTLRLVLTTCNFADLSAGELEVYLQEVGL